MVGFATSTPTSSAMGGRPPQAQHQQATTAHDDVTVQEAESATPQDVAVQEAEAGAPRRLSQADFDEATRRYAAADVLRALAETPQGTALLALADSTGCTALHAAGQAGRQGAFDLLLALGADAEQRNDAGEVAEVKQSSAEKCVIC